MEMGNVVGSIFSGLAQLVDKILDHPLDFLAGKSCNSTCRPTWDLMCYIENFCVSHLLKFAMGAILIYLVLLFMYLVYKLGICQCICRVSCGMIWGCCVAYFSAMGSCCSLLCSKRRERRRRRSAEFGLSDQYEDGSVSVPVSARRSRIRKDYRKKHLRRSLRPNGGNSRIRKKLVSYYGNTRPLHRHTSGRG